MFLGSYKIEFNGKNRLVLPKKLRRELGNDERFWVYLGQNGEIWGFDRENWLIQSGNILQQPLNSAEGQKTRLRFFSRAEEVSLDAQGRFILPQEFIDQVDLKGQVIVIGAGDHFEIWDAKAWEKFRIKLEG